MHNNHSLNILMLHFLSSICKLTTNPHSLPFTLLYFRFVKRENRSKNWSTRKLDEGEKNDVRSSRGFGCTYIGYCSLLPISRGTVYSYVWQYSSREKNRGGQLRISIKMSLSWQGCSFPFSLSLVFSYSRVSVLFLLLRKNLRRNKNTGYEKEKKVNNRNRTYNAERYLYTLCTLCLSYLSEVQILISSNVNFLILYKYVFFVVSSVIFKIMWNRSEFRTLVQDRKRRWLFLCYIMPVCKYSTLKNIYVLFGWEFSLKHLIFKNQLVDFDDYRIQQNFDATLTFLYLKEIFTIFIL